MNDTTRVIGTRDLTKVYQSGSLRVEALRGLTFSIERGEYVAIMGPSGSGKSTLMNVLGCLDRATSGQYLLDGIDVSQLDDNQLAEIRLRKLGFVFQGFNLLPRANALRNVTLPLFYAGMPPKQREKLALERLTEVGIGDRARHKPTELSGGEQQRVAIARALVNDPAVLLADEPTGNLDSKTSAEIMALFERLSAAGRTIIVVTHDEGVASRARRILRMLDGVIIKDTLSNIPVTSG
ncbi:MAG TPA: ABC transporter ATP-binding protein [Candidatus Rubrimentiphilum sp.]|nr:ABC transporter ATP-binding protein [Candidatus Rubrimentiphilum sp.]